MNADKVTHLVTSAILFRSPGMAERATKAIDNLLASVKSKFRESDRVRIPAGLEGGGRWTEGGSAIGFKWEITKPAVTEIYQAWVKDKVTGRRRKKDRVRVLEKSEGRWIDQLSGREVPKELQKEMEEHKIPKSWVGVKINPGDDTYKTWAIGYLKNGKTGEVSDTPSSKMKKVTDVASYKAKWVALQKFNPVKKVLEKKAYEDALNGWPQAQALFVIDRTGMRVGSGRSNKPTGRTKEGVETYGCTDLLVKHVKVQGDRVYFDFLEKGGKRYKKSFPDAKLATVIREALAAEDEDGNPRDKKGNERLFQTTADTVNNYITEKGGKDTKKYKMTAHSYRYWHATHAAQTILSAYSMPLTPSKAESLKKLVVSEVAKLLNDKESTVYQTYINPIVWMKWAEEIRPALPTLAQKKAGYHRVNYSPSRATALMDKLLSPDTFLFPDFGEDEINPEDIDAFADPDEAEPFAGVSWQKDVLDKQ